MKYVFFTALLGLYTLSVSAQDSNAITVIPQPLSVRVTSGSYSINSQTHLVANSDSEHKVAGLFNYYFKRKYGYALKITNSAGNNAIVLAISKASPASEAYDLNVSSQKVTISGSKAGIFYGATTLLQLIKEKQKRLVIPVVQVSDRPNFAYRGLMIDVTRHFFSVTEIKKMLDAMGYLKLNVFHWHLTDDQGWRLEIKKYPKLTTISAWRDSSIVGTMDGGKPYTFDGKRTGGFYTQNQAREVVKYAADRGIAVIPEIEMPGHATAALAAYPELGNGAASYQVPGYYGVHRTIFNPGEGTFEFLQNVLREVMEIFPSKYIHVGGDEVPKDEWKASAMAQQLISKNKLGNENHLQSWFISRIEKFLNASGRNLIGWDEILEGGLAPNATVMSWRGEEGGIEAARLKHQVVMTPGNYMYIDRYQSKDNQTEPLAIGGLLTLQTVYNYHPVPAMLKAEEQKYIMGVQANMWTEYVSNNNKLEYTVFPRLLAVAEVGWTKPEKKNYNDFTKSRVPNLLRDMDKFGINYRIPEADVAVTNDAGSNRRLMTITPYLKGCKLYYTLDGHQAGNTGDLYTSPVLIPFSNGKQLTLRYVIVTAEGRSSKEFTFEIEK
jgi:hexosaminidase